MQVGSQGSQGKSREEEGPKVSRWKREMVFDYNGSRFAWAEQVYSVTGMLADMTEGGPLLVAWKGICGRMFA